MSAAARQQRLLARLGDAGKAAIVDLAAELRVSDETIRRDLRALAADGLVEKYHGGVRLAASRTEAPFERRLRAQTRAKTAIAAAALRHVRDGAVLLLDNSSSACFFARALLGRSAMTVLTISLEAAHILSAPRSPHRVIVPGGEVRMADRTFAGPDVIAFIARFAPTHFIASTVAASVRGCQDVDLFEAEFKRAAIGAAGQTMMLLDSSKFARAGLVHVCAWDEIDVLVTDAAPPDIAAALSHGALLLADPSDPGITTPAQSGGA